MRPGRHGATMLVRGWYTLLSAVVVVKAHVPTYTGAEGNSSCYTPPHHHDTSQVIYVRGSGGLEIHCSAEDCPFDYANGEVLDVDAVFRDEVDQTTYALYIGCIGCMPDDPINIAPVPLSGYEPGELEPFTQTSYRSVFNKTERKYDSTLLDPSTCADGHFGIRLVQFPNASKDIVWGAVIGLGETFTLEELLSFPIFVLNNHGQTWNELPWTYYLILALTPVLTFADRWGMQRLGYGAWTPPSIWDRGMGDPRVEPRAWLLQLSAWGFIAKGLEELVHLVYAQTTSHWNYAFWVGLFGVILIANGGPLALVYTIWSHSIYHRNDRWVTSSPYWWPLELASALSFFTLFGAGFYIGPAFMAVDAFVRMGEMRAWREAGGLAPRMPGRRRVQPYTPLQYSDGGGGSEGRRGGGDLPGLYNLF